MKSLFATCLFLVGLLAVLGALMCAFATAATNDHRKVVAAGAGSAAAALVCFQALIRLRPPSRLFYTIIGLQPSLFALAALMCRTVSGILLR